MPDYSLVPVDYQPDFGKVSFVPVDYDPFGTDDMVENGSQLATQPRRLKTAAVQAGIGAPVQFSDGNKAADITRGDITGAPQLAPSIAPSDVYDGMDARLHESVDGTSIFSHAGPAPSLNNHPKPNGLNSNLQQYSMASHAAYSKCVDKCLHLLPSPSGDLQSSEFRLCVAQCMGRL